MMDAREAFRKHVTERKFKFRAENGIKVTLEGMLDEASPEGLCELILAQPAVIKIAMAKDIISHFGEGPNEGKITRENLLVVFGLSEDVNETSKRKK